jgi:hypothetical protein
MKPKINFTFPFRWLKEDKEFLQKNLERNLGHGLNKNPMHPMLMSNTPNTYFIRLKQHAYQPKPYKITKEELQEMMSGYFMGARCVGLEKFFVQTSSLTALPVMEMEIYF